VSKWRGSYDGIVVGSGVKIGQCRRENNICASERLLLFGASLQDEPNS